MNSFSSAWSELAEAVAESAAEPGAYELGYQSWTQDNLCVESFHEETRYFTSRWDALCPYVDVNPDMLRLARKPFIVYALPPEGPYGVPINDKYGLVDVAAPGFWVDSRRERKFRELDKMFRGFEVTEMVILSLCNVDRKIGYVLSINEAVNDFPSILCSVPLSISISLLEAG